MARRPRNPFLSRSFQRTLTAMTRSALRAGAKAVTQAARAKAAATQATAKTSKTTRPVKATKATKKHPALAAASAKTKPVATGTAQARAGVAISPSGARRYRLFKPTGVLRHERLPLLVMLHGCAQDARGLGASSRMNHVAVRERFLVLYPEQDRTANAQGCWNWFDTRTGRAEREADSIDAAIAQICLTQPVDVNRIAVAGLSAGASMAALLAMRRPERFRGVAMHSGVAPGVAHSTATALSAMLGRRVKATPGAPLASGLHLPALLVIHGSADHVVAPSNGTEAARLWAEVEGAKPGAARTVQRGARYPMQVTDYRAPGRLVATLCDVSGLGHAWSGGAASQSYSDPKGPDASRMIWSFMAKQFATVR
jgi:poly(hydroxyalkanoate) depolymerase family esterase